MNENLFVSPGPYYVTTFRRRANPLYLDIEPDLPARARATSRVTRAGVRRRLANVFQLQPVPRPEN